MKILSIEMSGIKSIDKPIKFDLYRKILPKDFEKKMTMKAIYGPNGSGKTGIISALSLYRTIVLYKNSLETEIVFSSLKSLINKKTKIFSISIIFANKPADTIKKYKHALTISLDGRPAILNESISILGERYEETVVFETKKGIVVKNRFKAIDSNNILEDVCKNVCNTSSFCCLLVDYFKHNGEDKLINSYAPVILTYLVCYSMSVSFGSQKDSISNNYLEFNENEKFFKKIFKLNLCQAIDNKKYVLDHYEYLIAKDDIDKFEKYLSKMREFISVIKKDLKKIEVGSKVHEADFVRCRINFVYDTHFVDLQYESTGIKKLVELYEALSNASKGNIAAIDEFDAGLHDVVFERLIKYFYENTTCQLIFTTHIT